MNEKTTKTAKSFIPKTKLSRKALIIVSASVGLILAGGLAFATTEESEEEAFAGPAEDVSFE